MSSQAWFTLILFLGVLAALSYPLAIYLARIGDPAPIGGIVGKLERIIYRAAGVDAAQDMPWTRYAVALLLSTPWAWRSSISRSGCRYGCH